MTINYRSSAFRRFVFVLFVLVQIFSFEARADSRVTAKGYAYCYDGTTQQYYPLEGARVELMDSDCNGSEICDDEMGRSYVRADGSFTVTGSGGDPGLIGADPDVYVRFAYNDDEGVRLTDELDSTRSWNTPEHDHDNTSDGSVIDFGVWSTGYGVSAGEGTECGVWRQGRIAFQAYKAEIGTAPPAGHLDIEYWSAIYAGTPWTNTDTIHWPIHYGSSAVLHEFGHSIRHAADGNSSHFAYDVLRFQLGRNHSICAADANRKSGESDESLRGFSFNEGWAEYWSNQFRGCPTPNRDIEGNIAQLLYSIQIANGFKHADMVSVLRANPGSIHSLDEFIGKLRDAHPGVRMGALSATGISGQANFAPYTENQRAALIAAQINTIEARIQALRNQEIAYRSNTGSKGEMPCKNCDDIFKRAVLPHLAEGEIKVLEIRLASLKTAAPPDWAKQVQSEISAGRYEAFIANYKARLRNSMRQAMMASLEQAQANVRLAKAQLSPAAFDAALSTIAKARARLEPPAKGKQEAIDYPLGWLPQISLATDDHAHTMKRINQIVTKVAPRSVVTN